MKIKKLLFPALLAGAVLALSRRARHQPKPDSTIQPGPGDRAYAAIDAYLAGQMRRLHIPGAALAIVEGDRIAHQRGFGRARPGGEVPTPQTPFFIGSLTKSFTALAVMQLVEAGKITLDAPVQHYLPWFRVADPQVSAQITVRHLLYQTSGLPVLPGLTNLGNFDSTPDAVERQVRALSTLKLNRPVGAKFEYSNLNYNILGLIAAAASGEPYPETLEKQVFEPLEMHHSYTTKAAASKENLAVGHRHWFSLPFPAPDLPVPAGSLPSGQLISSAEDMAHYLIAHLNGGCYQNVRILSSAGIDELHRGLVEFDVLGSSIGLYGMGWFEIDLGQIKTYSHSGNVPDFSAFMALIPEQRKAVILLFNADPYGLPIVTEETGMGVTALLAGQQPAPVRLEFIQWIMRLLPLIPLLQAVGVFTTLRRLNQWNRHPALRPGDGRAFTQHILLPLIPNLSLAAALAYLHSSSLLRYLQLYMPDIAWIARISGGFASIWAGLRTGLFLTALRGRSSGGNP